MEFGLGNLRVMIGSVWTKEYPEPKIKHRVFGFTYNRYPKRAIYKLWSYQVG